jgi:hypothetical protein
MDRRTFLSGSAVALAAAATAGLSTEAQAATWVLLGRTRVNGGLDRDVIRVGARAGVFNHIMLKVTGNDLLIYDLDVRYGNGNNDDIPVRLLIRQGGSTRSIDLRARNRFIREVRFAYGKFRNGRGATYVELYGRR